MTIQIVFMGTPEFASTILKKLCENKYNITACITQPDKPSGRKMKLTPPPVKQTAQEFEIPVLQPKSVRTDEFYQTMMDLSPDMIVTAAYGKILPERILQIPRLGCINVHGSLLPQYRGAAPVQWSLLNGDQETGVTIMKMDAGMDTGDVLSMRKIQIEEDMDAQTLMGELSILGADLLSDTLPGYINNEIKPKPQVHELATHAPMIQREQALIDWDQTATEIHNQVRGLSIWPGAYTFLDGQRLKIHKTIPEKNPEDLIANYEKEYGQPVSGAIIFTDAGNLTVACGKHTALNILNLQPQGSRKMEAKDCAHNYRLGTHFSKITEEPEK